MSTPETKFTAVVPRWVLWAGFAVAIGVATGGYFYEGRVTAPMIVAVPVPSAVVPVVPAGPGPAALVVAPVAGPVVAGPTVPSFDVVRVSPQGSAVIAGRAEPGADVVVFDGSTEVARTRADRRGEFVALPAVPLAAGGRALTLASRGAGGAEAKSDGAVMIVVPPQAAAAVVEAPGVVARGVAAPGVAAPGEAAPGPVAVLVPNAAPARVLQEGAHAAPGVTLDVVDYDDKGAIRFTGGAAASGAVRLYVDNGAAGDARADGTGRWSLTPEGAVSAGVHTVRVDSLDSAGRVVGRVEMPFQRASIPVAELAGGRVVVQPGQNLWRMARSAYGRGVRYTVIYLANRDQIRDPRLIYPGQAFAIPGGSP